MLVLTLEESDFGGGGGGERGGYLVLSSSRWAWCSRRAEEASGEQRRDLGNCPRQERGGRSWQKLLLRAAGMGWSLAAEPPRLWGEPLDVQQVTFFGEGGAFFFFKYYYSFPGLFPKVQPGKKMELERGLLDLSLPQTVALRRQACSTDRIPFLPPGTAGLSIHPRQPGLAQWPMGTPAP